LNSVKDFLGSVADKLVNSVTLNLGYIPNIGVNIANNTYNTLKFVVTYSISNDAPVPESANINLKAELGYKSFTNQSLTFEGTIEFDNSQTSNNQVFQFN